jgi:DNA polymerase-3 subunit alpha
MTLAEARGRYARMLLLSLNGSSNGATAGRLRTLLSPYRCTERAGAGACPVRLYYRNAEAETELSLPGTWRVRLDDRLLEELDDWLTAENVRLIYH